MGEGAGQWDAERIGNQRAKPACAEEVPPHKDRVFSEGKSANLTNLTIGKNEFRKIKEITGVRLNS